MAQKCIHPSQLTTPTDDGYLCENCSEYICLHFNNLTQSFTQSDFGTVIRRITCTDCWGDILTTITPNTNGVFQQVLIPTTKEPSQ